MALVTKALSLPARLREGVVESEGADIAVYIRRIGALIAARGRLEDAEVRAVMRMLADLRRGLSEDLLRITPQDKLWRVQHLGQLRAAVDRVTTEFASRYGTALTGAVNGAWEQGAAFPAASLAGARVEVAFAQELSRVQLEVISQMHVDLVRAVSDDFKLRAGRELTLGVAGAKPPFQIMRDVGELLRTEPLRGEMGTIANQAERIVRTEMGQAFSIANRVRGDEIAADVPGLLHYWMSARDGRVRATHSAADSRYAPGSNPGPLPWDKPFSVGGQQMLYPHDPRGGAANNVMCRCVDIKYKKEWFR